MKSSGAYVLIVARPGALRNSLRALLTTTPETGLVHQAKDGQSALRMVEGRCPDLVLIDLDLSRDDVPTVLARIKSVCPQSRCLVLADHTDQQLGIEFAGADVVVLKGFPAWKLVTTIKKLLSEEGT